MYCNCFKLKIKLGFRYLSPKIRGFQIVFKIGTKIRILSLCVLCILNSRLEKIEAAKLPLWVDYGQYTTQVLTTHEHNWHWSDQEAPSSLIRPPGNRQDLWQSHSSTLERRSSVACSLCSSNCICFKYWSCIDWTTSCNPRNSPHVGHAKSLVEGHWSLWPLGPGTTNKFWM